jgi:hypothetical protein
MTTIGYVDGKHIKPGETVSVDIDLTQHGPLGGIGHLELIPELKDDPLTSEEKLTDSEPRSFIVRAQLDRLLSDPPQRAVPPNKNIGSSYVRLTKSTMEWVGDVQHGSFRFSTNENAELSIVEFTCIATNYRDAIKKFYRDIGPVLDFLTFAVDAPLFVSLVATEDSKHLTIAVRSHAPFVSSLIEGSFGFSISERLLPIYQLYREARNSHSFFYQFLCIFKMLEGLFSVVRPAIFKEARVKNIDLPSIKDLVPDSPFFPDPLKAYVGKTVKSAYDSILITRFRNATAHFAVGNYQILNFNDPDRHDVYSDLCHFGFVCTRVVIENTEALARTIAMHAPKDSWD